jgi:hypothetical protein
MLLVSRRSDSSEQSGVLRQAVVRLARGPLFRVWRRGLLHLLIEFKCQRCVPLPRIRTSHRDLHPALTRRRTGDGLPSGRGTRARYRGGRCNSGCA